MLKTVILSLTLLSVKSEKKDSWTWFLVQLLDGMVSMESGTVIIFYRQKGLLDAVSTIVLNAH